MCDWSTCKLAHFSCQDRRHTANTLLLEGLQVNRSWGPSEIGQPCSEFTLTPPPADQTVARPSSSSGWGRGIQARAQQTGVSPSPSAISPNPLPAPQIAAIQKSNTSVSSMAPGRPDQTSALAPQNITSASLPSKPAPAREPEAASQLGAAHGMPDSLLSLSNPLPGHNLSSSHPPRDTGRRSSEQAGTGFLPAPPNKPMKIALAQTEGGRGRVQDKSRAEPHGQSARESQASLPQSGQRQIRETAANASDDAAKKIRSRWETSKPAGQPAPQEAVASALPGPPKQQVAPAPAPAHPPLQTFKDVSANLGAYAVYQNGGTSIGRSADVVRPSGSGMAPTTDTGRRKRPRFSESREPLGSDILPKDTGAVLGARQTAESAQPPLPPPEAPSIPASLF